jgi:hypothetical protein
VIARATGRVVIARADSVWETAEGALVAEGGKGKREEGSVRPYPPASPYPSLFPLPSSRFS